MTSTMMTLANDPKNVFFTGKGGVGKTSLSCAFAISQADAGHQVLLVSTDPASNLDEIFGVKLSSRPLPIQGAPGLVVMNIDPGAAAREYRERIVDPYRGVLPDAALKSIEEQLSGACTTEIAAFDAFATLLSDDGVSRDFDRIVFDTAPTGHTLRLLKLPAAWEDFLTENISGNSCLGPLAGLQTRKRVFNSAMLAIADPSQTAIILVARPDLASLKEAERTRAELVGIGVVNQHLAVNGIFPETASGDPLATALSLQADRALNDMPDALRELSLDRFPLVGFDLLGIESLRSFSQKKTPIADVQSATLDSQPLGFISLNELIDELAGQSQGVIMTMGKGGVGKTSIATAIAVALACSGNRVLLTTTDPAAHTDKSLEGVVPNLRVSHLDPESETLRHRAEVMQQAGANLDKKGRDLLEEDLRSPCTEEIAVFKAFSRIIDQGKDGFIVLDTAPTGHTLLLLDAADAYHREVTRTAQQVPEAVLRLRDRLRDPDYTKILLITLPEATPVHEAAYLQNDLKRAGISPYAWVVNQSLTPCQLFDPFLKGKRSRELRYLREVRETLSEKAVIIPLQPDGIVAGLRSTLGKKPLMSRISHVPG